MRAVKNWVKENLGLAWIFGRCAANQQQLTAAISFAISAFAP
jgi:hypothetical protein